MYEKATYRPSDENGVCRALSLTAGLQSLPATYLPDQAMR
jgi:hypothetical protein